MRDDLWELVSRARSADLLLKTHQISKLYTILITSIVNEREEKRERISASQKKMGASSLACFSSLFAVFPSHNNAHNKSLPFCSNPSKPLFRLNKIRCGLPESGIRQTPSSSRASSSKNRMEEYNLAMKKMMRNPYEYHHELGQFLLFF